MDWDGHDRAYGHSLYFGSSLVTSEQAKPPYNPQEAHRFQRVLVHPPPLHCHLCASNHSRLLPLPNQEMVRENGMLAISLKHVHYFLYICVELVY